MNSPEAKRDIRPWGEESWLTEIGDSPSMVKVITVRKGEALSLQFHNNRTEDWFVVSGEGEAQIGDGRLALAQGSQCHIPRGTKHRVTAGSSDLVFVEVARGAYDESDIVRLEDRYGRV